jgi:hypothetical protein
MYARQPLLAIALRYPQVARKLCQAWIHRLSYATDHTYATALCLWVLIFFYDQH